MCDPLSLLSVEPGAGFFAAMCFLCLVLMGILVALGQRLVGKDSPKGLLDLTLVAQRDLGDRDAHGAALAIVGAWKEDSLVRWARASLLVDYLFLVSYTVTLVIVCSRAAAQLSEVCPWASVVGVVLAWLVPLAALLDAFENVVLWRLLSEKGSNTLVRAMTGAALAKFCIVFLALAFGLSVVLATGVGLGEVSWG